MAVAVAVQARVDDCGIDLERREGLGKVCSERQTERASSDPELEATRASRCVVIQDEIALWWRPPYPSRDAASAGRVAPGLHTLMEPPPIPPAGAQPPPPTPPPGGAPAPPPGAPHLPPSGSVGPVGLEDEEEQIQQALAASLVDHNVPNEERDFQRALAASLQHPGIPQGHESQVGSYYIPAPELAAASWPRLVASIRRLKAPVESTSH